LTEPARQRRGRSIAMTAAEVDEFLTAERTCRVTPVGDIPRTAAPDPALAACELLFARKYTGRDELAPDGRHARLRLTPEKLVSWDFRKFVRPSR
jgi:hypothetical protein